MSSSTLPVQAIVAQYVAMIPIITADAVFLRGTEPDPTQNITLPDADALVAKLRALTIPGLKQNIGNQVIGSVSFSGYMIPNGQQVNQATGKLIAPTKGIPGDCVDASQAFSPAVTTPGWPIIPEPTPEKPATACNLWMWVNTFKQLSNGNEVAGEPVLMNVRQLQIMLEAFATTPNDETYNDLAAIFPLPALLNAEQNYLKLIAPNFAL